MGKVFLLRERGKGLGGVKGERPRRGKGGTHHITRQQRRRIRPTPRIALAPKHHCFPLILLIPQNIMQHDRKPIQMTNMQWTKIVEECIIQKTVVDAKVYRLQAGGDHQVVGPAGAFCWGAIITTAGGRRTVVGIWDGRRRESGGGGGLGSVTGEVEAIYSMRGKGG